MIFASCFLALVLSATVWRELCCCFCCLVGMDPSLAEVVASLYNLQQQIQDLRDTNAILQANQPQVLTLALHNLQQQIQELRESNNNQPETRNHITQPRRHVKELKVSMPEKFDGTRSKSRGFVQQVRLLICLQHDRYPTVLLKSN